MKVLIVKTSSMGDIIHALPVAHDLKAALGDGVELHWVAEESFREIPRLAPGVDRIYVTAFRRWRKHPFSKSVREEISSLKAALEAEHYDVVLDIQGLLRSGLVCRWTKAHSIGYSFSTLRERLAGLFYDERLDLPEELGAVKRYRMAAAQVFHYEIDQAHPVFGLQARLKGFMPEGSRYAALAVNTSRDEKLWPEEHWLALGRYLLTRGLSSAFFWGNDVERERVERLAAALPGAVVVPRDGLESTAATLSRAAGVIGVDTGLTHLGAALGRPSVGIFVSTPTETLKLWGDGPVTSLGGIGVVPTVEEVISAFEKVLGESK